MGLPHEPGSAGDRRTDGAQPELLAFNVFNCVTRGVLGSELERGTTAVREMAAKLLNPAWQPGTETGEKLCTLYHNLEAEMGRLVDELGC